MQGLKLGGGRHHSPPSFQRLGGLLGGLGLVLLALQRLKLSGQPGGLLAGLGGRLAGVVALGLSLPGFLRCCCAGLGVLLCGFLGLLLDLLGAGLGTAGPVGGGFQLGSQHGGLLFGGGAALLCLGQCGA